MNLQALTVWKDKAKSALRHILVTLRRWLGLPLQAAVPEDHGQEAEDVVETVCRLRFLADFVVRSPKYKKPSGSEREAADFLVPFGDHLFVFQVKSKRELTPASEKTAVDFQRIERKIDEGIGQLKEIRRACRVGGIATLRNSVGIDIPFSPDSVDRMLGVVIIGLPGEELFPADERTVVYNGFEYRHDMPVHVFQLEDFETLTSEVDTLPDFIDYLQAREQLHSRGVLGPVTRELDFLAFYKSRKDLLAKLLRGEVDRVVLGDGLWEGYREEHRQSIDDRDRWNEISYGIDRVIEWFHKSIGFDPGTGPFVEQNGSGEGTVETYWQAITELSKLGRLEKRMVARRWLEKMRKADEKGHGHSVLYLNPGEAILVAASNRERHERAEWLRALAATAYCHLNLKKIVALATEPLSVREQSFDFCLFEDVEFDNAEELAGQWALMFGPTQKIHVTEFPQDVPASSGSDPPKRGE